MAVSAKEQLSDFEAAESADSGYSVGQQVVLPRSRSRLERMQAMKMAKRPKFPGMVRLPGPSFQGPSGPPGVAGVVTRLDSFAGGGGNQVPMANGPRRSGKILEKSFC